MSQLTKKIGWIVTIIVAMNLSIEHLNAQEVQFGFDLQVGAPQNDFKTQLGQRLGVGIDAMAGYRFTGTPFMLGVDLGFMNFGTETREEPLSTTIPDLRVEVENSYNLFHMDLLLRVLTPEKAARPYLEGLVGFNHFFTETVLRERGSFNSEPEKLRDTNFRDTTLSYGFGAGLQFRVYKGEGTDIDTDINGPYYIYVHLGSRYMFGREAEYLKEGSIIREDNGNVRYDVLQSTTDLLHFKLGVTIGF